MRLFSRSNSAHEGLCRKCNKIVYSLDSNRLTFFGFSLGSASDVESRERRWGCACCSVIRKMIYQDANLSSDKKSLQRLKLSAQGGLTSAGLLLTAGDNTLVGYLHINSLVSPSYMSLTIGNWNNTRNLLEASDYIKLNMGEIQEWIEDCELNHGGYCFPESASAKADAQYSSPALLKMMGSRPQHWKAERSWADNPEHPHDLWLIDVEKRMLVRKSWQTRYVTLSYVWGTKKFFQTHKENHHLVQQEGFLDHSNSDIPRVVQDSMSFVERLGETYLWVDALCIVQGGLDKQGRTDKQVELDKQAELERMDMIYGQSVLTIVALSGSCSDDLLPRVGPELYPPGFKADLQDWSFVSQPPSFEIIRGRSTYETRGWTFQERLLSKRRIYFTYQAGVTFECSKGLRGEIYEEEDILASLLQEDQSKNPITMVRQYKSTVGEGSELSTIPVRAAYQELVTAFSRRKLTCKSDILNAFAGIAAALSKIALHRGFWSGMPIDIMDTALLWVSSPGPRRLGSKPLVPGGEHKLMCPTWSWASVTAPIRFLIPFRSGSAFLNQLQDDSITREWTILGVESPEKHMLVHEACEDDKGEAPEAIPEFKLIQPQLKHGALHVWAKVISAKEFWKKGGDIVTTDGSQFLTESKNSRLRFSLGKMDRGNELATLSYETGIGFMNYMILPKYLKGYAHVYDVSKLEIVLMSRIKRFPPLPVSYLDTHSSELIDSGPQWEWLNVMLVASIADHPQYVCRAAIGHIHESHWKRVTSTKKYVRLG